MEKDMQMSLKLEVELPYNPEIPDWVSIHLEIYHEVMIAKEHLFSHV